MNSTQAAYSSLPDTSPSHLRIPFARMSSDLAARNRPARQRAPSSSRLSHRSRLLGVFVASMVEVKLATCVPPRPRQLNSASSVRAVSRYTPASGWTASYCQRTLQEAEAELDAARARTQVPRFALGGRFLMTCSASSISKPDCSRCAKARSASCSRGHPQVAALGSCGKPWRAGLLRGTFNKVRFGDAELVAPGPISV